MCCLSIAAADANTPEPDVRHAGELEQALHGAVLAVRAVQERETRRRPDRTRRATQSGRRGARPRRRAGETAGSSRPRISSARASLSDPPAFRRDADRDDVVPVRVERAEHAAGGDAGDRVLAAATAEDHRDPDPPGRSPESGLTAGRGGPRRCSRAGRSSRSARRHRCTAHSTISDAADIEPDVMDGRGVGGVRREEDQVARPQIGAADVRTLVPLVAGEVVEMDADLVVGPHDQPGAVVGVGPGRAPLVRLADLGLGVVQRGERGGRRHGARRAAGLPGVRALATRTCWRAARAIAAGTRRRDRGQPRALAAWTACDLACASRAAKLRLGPIEGGELRSLAPDRGEGHGLGPVGGRSRRSSGRRDALRLPAHHALVDPGRVKLLQGGVFRARNRGDRADPRHQLGRTTGRQVGVDRGQAAGLVRRGHELAHPGLAMGHLRGRPGEDAMRSRDRTLGRDKLDLRAVVGLECHLGGHVEPGQPQLRIGDRGRGRLHLTLAIGHLTLAAGDRSGTGAAAVRGEGGCRCEHERAQRGQRSTAHADPSRREADTGVILVPEVAAVRFILGTGRSHRARVRCRRRGRRRPRARC